MTTSTLFFRHELVERDVARILEQEFSASWFPEYHRCSIDADDAFVAVDLDPGYAARLSSDERRALETNLGFLPQTALHVQASTYYAGSPRLADAVLQSLSHRFEGRTLSAA